MTPDQHARLREFARRVIYAAMEDGRPEMSWITSFAMELDLVETKIATQADIDDAVEEGRPAARFEIGREIDVIDFEIRSRFSAVRADDRLRPGERIGAVENRFDDREIVTRRVIADERLRCGPDFSEPLFEFVSVLDLNESQVATRSFRVK